MYIIQSRSNGISVLVLLESTQQLQIRAGILNSDNISIQILDRLENVIEIRVTKVRVNLSLILDSSARQQERVDSPLQVLTPTALTQGQTFTDSRLVNLNDTDASLLQINNLLTESKSQLEGSQLTWLVITHKRPLQHSNRTSQHTLHNLGGILLSKHRLLHRHGGRTADITINNWRLHTARAIGLHPTILTKDVTLHLHTKVLNHIGTLKLTVHQNVQTNFLLTTDTLNSLLLQKLLISLSRNLSLLESQTSLSNLRSLREGANGGGWEQRQVQQLSLSLVTDSKRALTTHHLWTNTTHLSLNVLIVNQRGGLSSLNRLLVGSQLSLDTVWATVQSLGQNDQLAQLLHRETQPVQNLLVHLGLGLQRVWSVQERTARRYDQSHSSSLVPIVVHSLQR